MIPFLSGAPVPLRGLKMTVYAADEEDGLQLLVQDQDFLQATNRQEQIAIAGKYLLRFVGGRRMTFESVARFFGVRLAIIQVQIELAKSSVSAPGRQVLLFAATKEWLENRIGTRFEEWNPITYAEVFDSFQYDRRVVLTADTRCRIIRHMESVNMTIGQPMEAERVAVDPDEICAWFYASILWRMAFPVNSFSIWTRQVVPITPIVERFR
jgi:hypothetical protein